jgi:hypothetical protein
MTRPAETRELREVMARAMCKTRWAGRFDWDALDPLAKETWLESADAALAAIEASGNCLVPVDQLADIYKRFKRLTHIGQAEVEEWIAMPPGEATIRHAVFAEADFGALYSGQWLPRAVHEQARTEVQAEIAARSRDVAPTSPDAEPGR